MSLISYDIDFQKMVTQYVRPHLSKMVRLQWLASFFVHLRTIQNEFLLHFKSMKNEMKWDGRTILLERYLQLKFSIPEIKIINNSFPNNSILGYPCPNSDNEVGYSADSLIGIIGFSSYSSVDFFKGFTITLPIGSVYNEENLIAEANHYLIGGSDFEIIET